MSSGIEYLQSPEKRALDVCGSIVLAPIASALAGLSAVVLLKEVGGWENTLFSQERVGVEGGTIVVPKIRTIHPAHTEGKPTVAHGTMDPRAGRVGKFIRQFGFDESLQIMSVLKGDMSLVGPRPRPESELPDYQESDPSIFDEWFDFYKSVRPGLCGLSQIMRHSYANSNRPAIRAESMKLELQYAEEASIAMDMEILARTPFDLLRAAHSAYREAKA